MSRITAVCVLLFFALTLVTGNTDSERSMLSGSRVGNDGPKPMGLPLARAAIHRQCIRYQDWDFCKYFIQPQIERTHMKTLKKEKATSYGDCLNLNDDSCNNGEWIGSVNDGDYWAGSGPGKRDLSLQTDELSAILRPRSFYHTLGDCLNLNDDSCNNGEWIGSVNDGDYWLGSGPGKK